MAKLLRFPTERVEHDTCPKCGALNGPFERRRSGICNECLDRCVRRSKRATRHIMRVKARA